MTKTYRVNEIFYSLQGEGKRAGTANVFVRFSGCNLRCDIEPGPLSPGGFACDTEFVSGRSLTLEELAYECQDAVIRALPEGVSVPEGSRNVGGLKPSPFWPHPWLILTGGEPALQVDEEFCDFWRMRGVRLAIETNGSVELPPKGSPSSLETYHTYLDWITVSPKLAEHAIKQLYADEVKYVRGCGQAIPRTRVRAVHYLLSPAFDGPHLDPRTLAWCLRLVRENPQWGLTLQWHKFLALR